MNKMSKIHKPTKQVTESGKVLRSSSKTRGGQPPEGGPPAQESVPAQEIVPFEFEWVDGEGELDEQTRKLSILMKDNLTSFGASLERIITSKLISNQDIESNKLKTFFNEKLEEQQRLITSLTTENTELKKSVKNLTTRVEALEAKQIKGQKEFYSVKNGANTSEQESKRWLIRVNGYPSPEGRFEEANISKSLVHDVLAKHLKMDIPIEDIDFAERTGKHVNGNQTIIAKLRYRNDVDHAIRNRRNLAGSGYALYEEVTIANQRLMSRLKKHDAIEKSWYNRGSVWGLTKEDNHKVRFELGDIVAEKITSYKEWLLRRARAQAGNGEGDTSEDGSERVNTEEGGPEVARGDERATS